MNGKPQMAFHADNVTSQMPYHAVRRRKARTRRAAHRVHPQCVCGACRLMEAQAPMPIHGSCLAVIRRAQKLVPNQRYNININSNSNSNSYLLLLSREANVFRVSFSALILEWRHQNSGSYFSSFFAGYTFFRLLFLSCDTKMSALIFYLVMLLFYSSLRGIFRRIFSRYISVWSCLDRN